VKAKRLLTTKATIIKISATYEKAHEIPEQLGSCKVSWKKNLFFASRNIPLGVIWG